MTLPTVTDKAIEMMLRERGGATVPGGLENAIVAAVCAESTRAGTPRRWLARAFRPALVFALLVLLLAALLAAIAVGSRMAVLPAPFGPARNGLIVMSISGDIVTVDPATGTKTVIVAGPETDQSPVFSGLGTQILFTRWSDSVSAVFMADADGSSVRQLLSVPRGPQNLYWDWTADGRRLIYPRYELPIPRTFILDTVTGTTTEPHPGVDQHYAMWRPGHDEYVFRSTDSGRFGYFLASADGSAVRAIAFPDGGGGGAELSPDGSKLVYVQGEGVPGPLHTIDIDTGQDRLLTQPGDGYVWSSPRFSPDGTQILAERYPAPPSGSSDTVLGTLSLVLLPLDGSHPVVELGAFDASCDGCSAQMQFSPDGTSVLVYVENDGTLWMLDTTGGPTRQLDWSFAVDRDQVEGPTGGAWQRLAP